MSGHGEKLEAVLVAARTVRGLALSDLDHEWMREAVEEIHERTSVLVLGTGEGVTRVPAMTDDDDLEYGTCRVCASGTKRRHESDGTHGEWVHVADGKAFSRAIRPHHAAPMT